MTDDLGGRYVAICEGADATSQALTECSCLVEVTLVQGMHRTVFRSWHPVCIRHGKLARAS